MVELNSEIILQTEKSIPKIDIELLNKSITFRYDKEHPELFTEHYIRATLFKWYSMFYLTDLHQLYLEVRYSYVRFLCHLEFYNSRGVVENQRIEHQWKMKYYAESAIYRYYSVWEIIGRFINAYFNLKLDENKKNKKTGKKFFFQKDVMKVVTKKYYHPLLSKIFELHGRGQEILKYRIIKTHMKNPKIEGASAHEMVKEIIGDRSKFILSREDEITIDELTALCENLYYCSKESIEYCGRFFDIGHDEAKHLEKDEKPEISKIIVPKPEVIKSINLMLAKRVQKKL